MLDVSCLVRVVFHHCYMARTGKPFNFCLMNLPNTTYMVFVINHFTIVWQVFVCTNMKLSNKENCLMYKVRVVVRNEST